jgi:hypothetical protein
VFKPELQGVALVLGIPIATLYFLGDARSRLSPSLSWQRVTDNIDTKLLLSVEAARPLTDSERNWLHAERRLLNIFYSILDSNESLKVKQNLVRFNSVIVTSIADVGIFCGVTALVRAIAFLIAGNELHLFWFAGLAFAWFLCEVWLIPLALTHQIELSNEQLEVISNHNAKLLRERVDEALLGMSSIIRE